MSTGLALPNIEGLSDGLFSLSSFVTVVAVFSSGFVRGFKLSLGLVLGSKIYIK